MPLADPTRGHRGCAVLRGPRPQTRAAAQALVAALPESSVLWVGIQDTPPTQVKRLLGQSLAAVVIDHHDGADADVVGQCHGLIRGGGALILRHNVSPGDKRFERRLDRVLSRAGADESHPPLPPDAAWPPCGTDEQARLATTLRGLFLTPDPQRVVLVADRGRGKSSALGLALAGPVRNTRRVVVTAGQRASANEIFRFAGQGAPSPSETPDGDGAASPLPFVSLAHLALETTPGTWDLIIVDEAAQLPVPLLKRLVQRHPNATIAFATTTHGYEGTGRGFSLRFLAWLRRTATHLTELTLTTPIRWGLGDPLEALVFDALLLDAELAPVVPDGPVLVETLDRDALVSDDDGPHGRRGRRDLSEFFGLLVQAHYRTTPRDLQRLLDAPNIALHALRQGSAQPPP